MSYQEMAYDLHHFLKTNGINENIVLLGHSMGARIVMEYATTYHNKKKDSIKGVIAVDLAPHDYLNDPRFNFIQDFYEKLRRMPYINLK